MPVGFVATTAIFAVCVGSALFAPHPRRSRPWRLSFFFANVVNELPFTTFFLLLASTGLAALDGDLVTAGGAVGGALALLTTAGLVLVVIRARRARPALERAFARDVGRPLAPPSRRAGVFRWACAVLWPFPWWARHVRRTADISYGPERHHRLDVFTSTQQSRRGPVLVHLHGGAFRIGRKNLEGRPLVNRLVSHGWLCVMADYGTGRHARFPEHVVDAKRVLAWVKEHADDYGADPEQVHLVGSSAGAHIAAVAGCTAGDARFQPGFEERDTTVASVTGLSGYYGPIATDGLPAAPREYVGPDSPPFAVVHGERDTLVVVEDARAFRDDLRAASGEVVFYAELPGAHHNFDMFDSLRCAAVVDAIEAFTTSVAPHGSR
jgi:acetyl esterase/lipase